MSHRNIFQKLRTTDKLPTPSRVALELIKLCYNDDSSLQDIAGVVEVDPALSAELLRYANSVLMGSATPVASVRRAAVQIGMQGIVNLALGFSLLSQYQKGPCENFDYNRFWSKSLAQAVAARAVAKKYGGCNPDEIFTCNLLSHIGELAFATAFPNKYTEILGKSFQNEALLKEEKYQFGLNHHELTLELLLEWGIPERLAKAAEYHEVLHIQPPHEKDAPLAELFFLAQQLADICMLELPLRHPLDEIESLAEQFNIQPETFNEFFSELVSDWQAWSDLFQIPVRQCPEYSQIKDIDADKKSVPIPAIYSEITILAVDDDPMTLLNLKRILNRQGRKILTADDGEKALELVLEERPDILVTDWRMPNLNGLELCRRLRQIRLAQHMYILMLTGAETDDELVEAFDAGVDDYVVKPFTPKVLEARIRSGERIITYQRTITDDKNTIEQYVSKLAAANLKLQNMAMTDALTDLPNRRSAMARLKDIVAESTRFNEKLSCILIDIDRFKRVNDTYGHDNGDIVLVEIAGIFNQQARSYDMISRIGGEEFLVISTRSNRSDALHLAERLRTAVENHEIKLNEGSILKTTISLGVAVWEDHFTDGNGLIRAADQALYAAKENGRNRVEATWELG